MNIQIDLRKDEGLKFDAINPKSPIVDIGPFTFFFNQEQVIKLANLLNHFVKAHELRR